MNTQELSARINELAGGYRQSQILFTAMEAEVFGLLKGPRSSEDVAAELGWSPRGTRMLLDGLVAIELVEKVADGYRNTPAASACLVKGAPAYQGNIIRHNRACRDAWLSLGEAVRTGTSAKPAEAERSPKELRDFILGMANIGRMSAREIVQKVDLSPYHHVLDAGGGPASYSIAFLKAHPHMRATLFDRPEVIHIAREEVAKAELEERFAYRSGDLLHDEIGSGYDLVLVSNIIHSMSADHSRTLVKKCFTAMKSGGLFIIKDFLMDADRSAPSFGHLFAINMLVNTAEGDTYSLADVEEWTRDAGFTEGRVMDVAANSRLWLTRKP
jgi:3-hydroxy-5-methyl-1-naphthoate 3-O-methyltransferase